MKVLKAALCLIFSVILTASTPSLGASADEQGRKYAVALTRDVYLCEEMDENSDIFAIPYSYCVEILKEYENWYHVRYARDDGLYQPVQGYCKKDDLMKVDSPPENTYLYYPLEVTLHSPTRQDSALPELTITVTAAFYGNYYRGAATYTCVRYNGQFGYVEGEIDGYETNPIPSVPSFSETPPANNTESGVKWVSIIIFAALIIAVIAILAFTGKRKKTSIQ